VIVSFFALFRFFIGLGIISSLSKVMPNFSRSAVAGRFRTKKKTRHNSICFRGTYGLWLDADLYHGRTCPSKTFNNVRLSTKEDFIIANVEVWTFVD